MDGWTNRLIELRARDLKLKNLERIGVHDGMCHRSPNQLLAKLTAH